jgi:hypothetical protein
MLYIFWPLEGCQAVMRRCTVETTTVESTKQIRVSIFAISIGRVRKSMPIQFDVDTTPVKSAGPNFTARVLEAQLQESSSEA